MLWGEGRRGGRNLRDCTAEWALWRNERALIRIRAATDRKELSRQCLKAEDPKIER